MAKMPSCDFDSDHLVLRLEVKIQADVTQISPIVDGVMRLVQQMGCAEGKETEVETALREALANAVLHGCRNDTSKEVQCCVACDESKRMLIIVRNPGDGFDPESLPNPTLGQNLFESHGRGIFLINQLMDEVHFEQGGTEIHMLKR